MEQRTHDYRERREDEVDERQRTADDFAAGTDRPEDEDRMDLERTEADEERLSDKDRLSGDERLSGDDRAEAERMDGDERDVRDDLADRPAAGAAADEQLTVPEDREAAAVADGRSNGAVRSTATEREFDLFPSADVDGFRQRWDTLQAGFVDDPKAAADQAEALVSELVNRVSRRHQELRDELGSRADGGDDTETMRLAIRQYRAFFHSLVGA